MVNSIKGYCHICGEPIDGNVDPKRTLECGRCVLRRVKHIERIELESGMSINNRGDYAIARKIAEKNPTPPTRKRVLKQPRGLERQKQALWSPNFKRCDLPIKWEDQ